RVAKMIAQGRMTEIGSARIEEAKRNGECDKATRREDIADVPREFKHALEANKRARANFERLAPSHKRQYIGWISDAKKDETRQRRIDAAIKMLKENQKLGIDTRIGDARKR
ncbi:MAG: YdeI/OmpD-associated family protein, partial [Anaerolineales bacterium]|nr:YdeI/OmpD-associated family protein [Anaerolineales bacterium]